MQPNSQKPLSGALYNIEMTKLYMVGTATIIEMMIACEVKVRFPFLLVQWCYPLNEVMMDATNAA